MAVLPTAGSPAANGSSRAGALLLRRPLALAMPASRAGSPNASPADDQGYASGGGDAALVAPADADAMFAGTLMSAQGGGQVHAFSISCAQLYNASRLI